MKIVERHILKSNKELLDITHKSKNLYNAALYEIRQYFFKNEKFLNYNKLDKKLNYDNPDYKALPAKVAQQTLKLVDQNFKSFFSSLVSYKKNPKKFTNRPKLPKYKDKESGYIVIYTKQAISKTYFNKYNKIKLSKTNIVINTKIKNFLDIQQVRIIPKEHYFIAEIVYTKKEKQITKNNNYAAIDIGLNNLTTVSFNNGKNPFVINGRPLKSINQFYNKKLSKLKSNLERRNSSKKSNAIRKLSLKRYNKVNDYLHKTSHIIVNQLVSNDISILIIGKNKKWKQDINIGKKNNQNFVAIPFNKLIHMITYKCKLEGITVIEQEESYTSKCSFLDKESIKKHDLYMGKRISRGLFKTSCGKIINADLNGSYNIMKKAISKFGLYPFNEIEGVVVHPRFISI